MANCLPKMKQEEDENEENDSVTDKGTNDKSGEHLKNTVTEYIYSEYFK